MAEINVPIVTIPQLHDSLQTISATDFIPIVQGSEYDRDAAATLSEILASKPFQDQKEWKTFLLSAAALDTGTWTHNALVLLDAWESSISYSGTSIKNALMIVIPKWSAAQNDTTSCTFAETEGTTCPILRGNFLLIRFGLDGKISSYFSIPASSVDAIAQLKSLSVTNAVNATNVTATNAVNAANVIAINAVVAGDIIHSNNNIDADNNITAANAVNAANVTATGTVNATNVNATGNVHAGDIAVTGNVQTTSLTVDSALTLPAKSIKAAMLDDGAVTTAKLADFAVTKDKIAGGAVTSLKLSDAVKILWRQCFSFSSTVLTPSGITSAYVACPRTLIEGFSLRIVIRSDTWSTSLQVVSIVIGGQTFTNLTSGWTYSDECYILDNVPITSSMCVDFINISINTANFSTGQLVMSVQQYV